MGGMRKVISTNIGVSYTLTLQVDMGTAEGLYIMPRTTNGGNINLAQVYVTTSGTHTVTFTASTSTTQLLVEKAGTVTQTFYIDNVKVEQSTPTLTSYPIADVVSAQHYYPFGSTMQRLKLEAKLNYFTRADKMTTEFEKDYNDAVKRGNIKKMDNVLLMSRVQTITHETFIHVNLSVMRKLGTPFKEYIGMGYGTDHYTEHMNTQNKVNTLWNTQGFDLLRELNLKRKTGWNSDRIWKSMWDFQY